MVSEMPASTEGRILDAAERIFLSRGFHRVSMDELARELAMSKKTLYAHFASKDDLVAGIMRRRVERVDAEFRAVLAMDAGFDAKVRGLMLGMQRRLGEVSPAFIEDLRRYTPEVFRIVEEYRAQAIPKYLGGLLEEGIREGFIREDVKPAMVVRMLVACVQGILRVDHMMTLDMPPVQALDTILRVIFQGVFTEKAREVLS